MRALPLRENCGNLPAAPENRGTGRNAFGGRAVAVRSGIAAGGRVPNALPGRPFEKEAAGVRAPNGGRA